MFVWLTSTHHSLRSRFTKRRRVHAMVDGVFECRNHFFDIRWQFDPTLDDGPHRNRRGLHQGPVQTNGLEIVVKIRSPTTMQRIARLPNARATILPVARSADVRAPFVSEKHVSPAIEALSVSLQSARTPGKGCKVSLVGHDDNEHVDVLGVGFGSDDRAQNRYALDTSDLAGRRHESAEPVKERLPDGPVDRDSSTAPQSRAGISSSGTRTSMDRATCGVRRIRPRRSSVTIMRCTEGGVTSKYR